MQHSIELLCALVRKLHQRQAKFGAVQQAKPPHHVFQRNRIGVEKDCLIEFEQFEVQPPSFANVSLLYGIAQLRDPRGSQVTYGIHQSRGADDQHRQTECLQTAEDSKLFSQHSKCLGKQVKI